MRVLRIGLNDVEMLDIDGKLETLQELVGGHIEVSGVVELRERGIEILCNEEGLLKGLEPNPILYPFFYVGQCVAVGCDGDDFVSLTDEQINFMKLWLASL